VPGFLEDYAFLSNALLDLYESCFDKRYLERAIELAALILDKFWADGLYFTPCDGEPLVHRPRAPYDNAWPSGISTSVFAFLRLYELTGHDLYRDRAEHESGDTRSQPPRHQPASHTSLPLGTSRNAARSRSSLRATNRAPPHW
jgi:uncharacterized protein YyaL (SSP411 family)